MLRLRRALTPHAGVAIVLVAVAALSVTLWAQPFGRDQGIFAYIGEGILNGRVPFRDAWDHKPPGIDFAYALAFALFGRQMVSVHILETCSVLLTSFLLHHLGEKMAGRRWGLLAALLFGAGTVLFFEWWDHGQAEMFMALFMTLSIYFLVSKRLNRRWALLGAGFFGSIAVDFKPTAALFVAWLFLYTALLGGVLWRQRKATWSTVAGQLSTVVLGAALGQVPMLLYFAVNGALTDLYQAVWLFNTYHVQTGANLAPEDITFATLQFGERMAFVGPLAILGAISWLRRREWGDTTLVLGWLLTAVAGVWMQGKFFSYHWSLVLPPLALLATFGVEGLWREFRAAKTSAPTISSSRLAMIVASALLLAVYGSVMVSDQIPKLRRDVGYFARREGEREYLAYFGHNIRGTDVYSFLAARDAASYLEAHTASDDTVLVWGFQALVNYLAHRQAPTRYIFDYPLTIEQPESEFRQQARDNFLADIRNKKPKYIVTVSNDVNPLQTVDSRQLLDGFPEFKAVIAQDYVLETDIADFHLYHRLETP